MVSFHNVRLPEDIEQGVEGGPEFKTTILELSSGFEKRNIEWSKVRPSFDIAYGIRTKEDLEAVIAFFYARNGRAYGWRFKDWSDFQIIGQPVATVGGITTLIQVFKRYTSGAYTYDREITRLVDDTLKVYYDGVLKTEGADYTVDIDTGLITLTSSPGTASTSTLTTSAVPGNGETVTIGGKVYTFQTTLTNVNGHVKIVAGNETSTLTNLKNAINASGGTPGTDYAAATTANASVTAISSGAHTVVVKSRVDGTEGDSITTSESLTNGAWGPNTAHLTGGVDVIVTIDVEFDLPMRFDMDKLNIQMHWEDAMEIPNIPIVGLKE